MEYLEGGTVHERLKSGRVPRAQALAWLEQAATALDRAHVNGVVHRDVKPANLLLDRDGNVHVSDFGIASATGVDTLTAPGTVLGTAGYLAPEQARGEPATPASDRYALGVVAFELLTGRRPFAGDTPTTEAFAHLHADVPSATALDPALPPSVDGVFESALAKDPAARPATAQELVARLREAFDSSVVVPPTPPTLRRHGRSHSEDRPQVAQAESGCRCARHDGAPGCRLRRRGPCRCGRRRRRRRAASRGAVADDDRARRRRRASLPSHRRTGSP